MNQMLSYHRLYTHPSRQTIILYMHPHGHFNVLSFTILVSSFPINGHFHGMWEVGAKELPDFSFSDITEES